ncbi:MAG TPA: hypothetical protein VK968_16310 [Roseimicrobium sp.]|nr:hypothetical protein [Roseimicrobium sp.]
MKKAAIALASALLLVVLFLSLRPGKIAPASPTPPPAATPAITTATPPTLFESAPIPAPAPKPAAPAPVLPASPAARASVSRPTAVITPAAEPSKAADLNIMHEAMISYDPANLPVIARYLDHTDKELRTAALNNMLQMGDKAAAALLRKAAETAATPQEAVAMLDAATYLELPSGLELLKKKKARFTATKTSTPPAVTLPPAVTPDK